MAIKYNWQDLQKRIINGQEVEKVMYNWVQIRPDVVPPTPNYLCFTATKANTGIWLEKIWYGPLVNLEISYNGESWIDYNWLRVSLSNIWDKVYFRNKSETPTRFSVSVSDYYTFDTRLYPSWSLDCSWDLTTLLCKEGTLDLTGNDYCFFRLFRNCDAISTPPRLPATTLAPRCYHSLFAENEYLESVPELPATTLEENCYSYMFRYCTWITAVPQLPATTLAESCYESMFDECSNIKLSTTRTWDYQTPYTIPSWWTGTDATDALTNMFANTWWTFTWTPSINTTYYTSNTVI